MIIVSLVPKYHDLASLLAKQLTAFPEGRLPTVRELADAHATSTKTIAKALDLLRRDGLIESRPGSGLWRAGRVPASTSAKAKINAFDFADRLCEEIRQGLHPWSANLPSIKEFATRWKCHPQTASKALDTAVRTGLVERYGRRHRPVRPRTQRKVTSPTLLCIGAADPAGLFRMDTDRESDFWRDLGSQAAHAGLSLVRRPWNGERILLDPSNVGVVASTWHCQEPVELRQELERLRLPVCLWMEEYTLQDTAPRKSRIQFHEQGYHKDVGALSARHLLDLGHSRFAYISPWHTSRWSKNRFQGIEEEVRRQGGRVEAYCLEGISVWDRLAPAYRDPRIGSSFPHALLGRLVEGSSTPIREATIHELGMNRTRKDIIPLLERALESGATAWIAANDVCALQALSWLHDKGVKVPCDVSLAGFDDTSEALRADLTSYRFASDSMARAMIRQILSSSRKPSVMRHEGVVVARGSTAILR
ncbi:MAG: substrate-binding domain-containing protein [Fibrobacteres bacterium]|nr:substrate-binding domain-containing protein [Fibrobacterota bacterium]